MCDLDIEKHGAKFYFVISSQLLGFYILLESNLYFVEKTYYVNLEVLNPPICVCKLIYVCKDM